MKRHIWTVTGFCVAGVALMAASSAPGDTPQEPRMIRAAQRGGGGIVRPPVRPLPPIDQPIVSLPDLKCTEMTPASGEFMFDLLVNFQVKLRNRFGQLPPHFVIELRLRRGETVHKAQQYVVADPQGQETVVTCPFRLTAVPGVYAIDVVVDVYDEVREQDETNNTTSFGPFMIVY